MTFLFMWLAISIHEIKCKWFIDKIIIILLFTQLYCSCHPKISFFLYCKSSWYQNYPLKWVSQIPWVVCLLRQGNNLGWNKTLNQGSSNFLKHCAPNKKITSFSTHYYPFIGKQPYRSYRRMTCCVPLKGYTHHRSRTPALNKTCKAILKCYIGSNQNEFSKADR